ncbi:FG-GAP-like repeat-containing protein [Thermodesulfobacteriota bacterium]
MKKHILTLIVCSVLLTIGSVLVATATASAETSSGILIVPFNIHAEKDQSFLKPATTDMLYTRLSAENRTVLVEKVDARTDPVSAEDAIAMGRQQNVDYVLFGSITILGAMISTDAQLVGVAMEKPLLTFNEVGQDPSDIITHMEHLTTRINETVFGIAKAVVPPPASDPASEDIHIHPEKLLIPGITPQTPPATTPSAPPTPAPLAPPAPAVVMAPQADKDEVSLSYWKSESFPEAIQGLSIADVDGDGSNEVVFISGNQVFVYRYRNEGLQKIKTFSHTSFSRLMFVDTADINRNGTPEIFVTDYISSNQRLKSIVLEWNGQDFAVIDEMIDWYLRVLHAPASGSLLLGQKRGSGSSFNDTQEALFDRDIHEMKWQDGHYTAAGRLALPKNITLYDFTQGDVSNDGQIEIVAFSRTDHIRVYDQTGEYAWESDEVYGGSRLFFEVPEIDDARKTTNYYLPQRIHVTDIDRNGLNEIIVLKNKNTAGIFSRIKAFKEGHIDCLSYDDIGVQRKWQTRNIAGYISDYVIGDLNNDGINEVVLSTVAKNKSILSKGKSYIISCKLVSK